MKKFSKICCMFALLFVCFSAFLLVGCSENPDDPKPAQYEITVNSSSNGSVTGYGKFDENATCNLTATPTDGYYLDYWEMDGTKYYGNDLQFKVTKNTSVNVQFKKGVCYYLQQNTNKRLIVVNGSIEEYGSHSLKVSASDDTFSYWWTDNSATPISFIDELTITKSSINAETIYTAENTLVGAYLGFSLSENQKETLTNSTYTSLTNCDNMIGNFSGYYYFDGTKLNCTVSQTNKKTEVTFTLDCSQFGTTHYALFGKIFTINNVKNVLFFTPDTHPNSLSILSKTYNFANDTKYTIEYYC